MCQRDVLVMRHGRPLLDLTDKCGAGVVDTRVSYLVLLTGHCGSDALRMSL